MTLYASVLISADAPLSMFSARGSPDLPTCRNVGWQVHARAGLHVSATAATAELGSVLEFSLA